MALLILSALPFLGCALSEAGVLGARAPVGHLQLGSTVLPRLPRVLVNVRDAVGFDGNEQRVARDSVHQPLVRFRRDAEL